MTPQASAGAPLASPVPGADTDAPAEGGSERLQRVAKLPVTRVARPAARLRDRLRRPRKSLDSVYQRLAIAPAETAEMSRGAEWLLDNHYIVRRALRLLHDGFPHGFERRLPLLAVGELRGHPRAYALALALEDASRGPIDLQATVALIGELQFAQPLSIAEVWALPAMLRLAVLERLAKAADAIAAATEPDAGRERPEPDAVIGTCIRSLRSLETTDWKHFFEAVSATEHILRTDPADSYARMDFETRDLYRKAVEDLAARSDVSETAVATRAIRCARDGDDAPANHVGHYLIGAGRSLLEHRLAYRPPWKIRLRRLLTGHPTAAYVGSILLLTLLAETLLARHLWSLGPFTALLAVGLAGVPAWTVAVSLMNGLVTRLLPPTMLPKLDCEDGIPADAPTLVAVPALLTSADEIETLVRALEIRFLANPDPHLRFALLTDFGDAAAAVLPEDAPLLQLATERMQALNARYGAPDRSPFHLLHRPRRWSASEGCWMGWERKRGKLSDLNRLLTGDAGGAFAVHIGDPAALASIRYVITLDADTELPRASAGRLVGTLAHPLNRARFDAQSGVVVGGYTILQPRIEISPLSAEASWFSRLFSAGDGLDPYTRAVSDVYQDLFGQGVYTGKGIYDVAAFERSLAGRVPEPALLSHDLFEGVHGRTALATDIVLVEDYPSQYLAYAQRLHRWARGDWQLLPWLGRRVPTADGGRAPTRLSFIARWMILDNLRRSLLAPSLLALLVALWLWSSGSLAAWTLLVLLVPAIPGLTDFTSRLVLTGAPMAALSDTDGLARSMRAAAASWCFEIAFLPHQAAVLGDAIVRTLVRVYLTRTRLLEWTSAAHTARGLVHRHARAPWREMAAAPLVAGTVTLLLACYRPEALVVAGPLLLLWAISPEIAARISRPRPSRPEVLSPADIRCLRMLARRTWAFFETFVGPDDQWLPPDHFQEEPRGVVARRTSPTNIGLLQLATISAYDLGHRGLLWVILRLKNTFDTLERMERYRGHFFNWYDTATLEPLLPRYVSTVDSGNLVGALLAVKQTCIELARQPVVHTAAWQGLLDTLDVLDEAIRPAAESRDRSSVATLKQHIADIRMRITAVKDEPLAWHSGIGELIDHACPELERIVLGLLHTGTKILDSASLAEMHFWSRQLRHDVERLRREMEMFAPWLSALAQTPVLFGADTLPADLAAAWGAVRAALPLLPTLTESSGVCTSAITALSGLQELLAPAPAHEVAPAREWIAAFTAGLEAARHTAQDTLERVAEIADRADRLVQQTEFAFLYDARRRLFHLGYDATAAKLDANYYDLLASEARLASFVAIAKSDVPEEHWIHLGRPIGNVDGHRALLSWSGTMFEYLMPGLLLREGRETLMGHSCAAAVQEQIAYGRDRGVPWGISESGYYRVDAQQNYQYRAFGVPELGFKRGLSDELVVSPYASLLALPLAPQAVLSNLAALQKLGMWGRYGLYEAIDFTWSRLSQGQRYGLVRSYMAHHQGMILATLNNFLNDDTFVRRFAREPMTRTAELLLVERPPSRVPLERTRPFEPHAQTTRPLSLAMDPWPATPDVPFPQAHVLSNGRYRLLVTDAGGVASWWGSVALTRWHPDTTLDDSGFRIYIQEADGDDLWTLFRQPVPGDLTRQVQFHPHAVELQARHGDIAVRETIAVAPNADIEIRYLTITNEGSRHRRLTITSYGEVALNDPLADRSHPAFSKLFVESEYLAEHHALVFERRRRSNTEPSVILLHTMVLPATDARPLGYEGSRERFLGRGGSLVSPAALASRPPSLSCSTGATLDPVMALAAEVALAPHCSRTLAFVTMAAESRDAALALADAHRSLPELDWIVDLARTHSATELTRIKLDPRELPVIERLLSLLLYSHPALRPAPAVLERNIVGQSALWKFALSGDFPILLVSIHGADDIPLLHEILCAQAFWRGRGVVVDLVILNEHARGYNAEADDRILRVIAGAGAEGWLHRTGGIFLIHADQVDEADRLGLMSAARVVLDGAAGRLAEQVTWPEIPARLPPLVPTLAPVADTGRLESPGPLLFDNGRGGFSANGKEYVIHLESGERTPAPWVNVIANSRIGFVVSEVGGGYTWAENSGENRLTPWRNDPVCDEPGEVLYLRDEETGEVWSPTSPAQDAGAYEVRHGAGYTVFRQHSHALEQEVTLFVPLDDPVKVIQLRLTNRAERPRRITATYYAEWVLGTTRDVTQPFILPSFDTESQILSARNPWNEDFRDAVAFLAGNRTLHGFTTDRAEFLGRHGQRAQPAALHRIGLANTVRPGLDPCAAVQLHIDLAAAGTTAVHFLLGEGSGRDEALHLVGKYRPAAAVDAALQAVHAFWDQLLSTTTVRTPDPAFDVMVNRWLAYQTVSSRVWGRTGFYQSSGAFGFRDQLQDVAALIHAAPQLCRAHVLECARHQFEEGDVLHWWHPPSGAGIRTRCADDLLWLPYVTALYVRTTGDRDVLAEAIPFLKAEPLRAEEGDRYNRFRVGEAAGTLYEHCRRAIDKGHTAGAHGLPLFGSGDWNDGMNRVGAFGRGESVWLGWFLYATLRDFVPVCVMMNDPVSADDLRRRAEDLLQVIEANGWDGAWYRRGFYDDGVPLGSITQDECQIDSIAQSWAVLSGAAEVTRARRALHEVRQRLVHHAEGLILLLAPPFNHSLRDPGYIAAYPPGVRENGGQYTHAAVWVVWALLELGEVDLAVSLFAKVLPTGRTEANALSLYRVEPYALAADVYGAAPHTGRGGWTWYTGSAGWAYRFAWEKVLGLHWEAEHWRVEPAIPRSWPGFEMNVHDGATAYAIRVENPQGVNRGIRQATLDGTPQHDAYFPRLRDGIVHQIHLVLGD